MSSTTTTTTIQTSLSRGQHIKGIPLETGEAVRLAARNNIHTSSTSGLAPGYLQANMIILPSRYASDFRLLCARNPVPCPLLAESSAAGRWDTIKSAITNLLASEILSKCDLRRDAPRYMVYKDSALVKFGCQDITEEWTDDHTAFLIGCSYSFESALAKADLPPRHTVMNRNVPMYRTKVPLAPAGAFTGGTYVVSMRPYPTSAIPMIREITRRYSATHGEPIAWGWDAVKELSIQDIDRPEWGEPPLTLDGRPLSSVGGDEEQVPVFWGCGVTPQEAVMRAGLEGVVMAHAPGHMLVLDCVDDDVIDSL